MATQHANSAGVLATDLDGTLIPLEGNEYNHRDLEKLSQQLSRNRVPLVFVTGRHLESVMQAMDRHSLPVPSWVICDVGTSIYEREKENAFVIVEAYHQHLQENIGPFSMERLKREMRSIKELRLQEDEKQGSFKLSFYTDAAELSTTVGQAQQQLDIHDAPYSIISSVDPFTGDGLIDLLPRGVSKAYALNWWVQYAALVPDVVVFAGDSGNDLAALSAGYRSIVVANSDREVAAKAAEAHRRAGWNDRLYLAKRPATSGVLEGCRRFGLI